MVVSALLLVAGLIIVLTLTLVDDGRSTTGARQSMPKSELTNEEKIHVYDEHDDFSEFEVDDIDTFEDIPDALFDVVIPFHPKDLDILPLCVDSVVTFVKGVGTIYIITPYPRSIQRQHMFHQAAKRVRIVDERDVLDCSKQDLEQAFSNKSFQVGWYLQQLLKLYAFRIPHIRSRYVCVDADLVFYQPVEFVDKETNQMLFALRERGINDQYVSSAQYLLPELQFHHSSAIIDHMIFDADIVKDMLSRVETQHPHLPFWKLVCEAAKRTKNRCGFSEYEMVFAFVKQYYPQAYRLRPLRYLATGNRLPDKTNVDLVVYHSWMGKEYTVNT